MAHSARTFSDAAQRKLAGSRHALFDLSEPPKLRHFAFSIGKAISKAAVVDLCAHQLRRRSTNFSVCRCRCWKRVQGATLLAVDTDDATKRFEIGFAAVMPESAEACSGLRPRFVISIPSTKGTNAAALIAAAPAWSSCATMIWASASTAAPQRVIETRTKLLPLRLPQCGCPDR